MKQILIIFGFLLATVSTFAQSPRIKLNQITKDSVTGSVLISSPSDSGMVYSRDLFISYGADTFLILGGDTLAATSSIISSVLSDGVTITGDGTLGSELTVDTATVISTIQGLVDTLTNYVTIAGTETITGAKTFTSDLNVDGGTATISNSTSTNLVVERTGSNGVYMSLKDGSGNTVFLGANNGDFQLQTPIGGFTNKLVVKNSGNVGIGATNPSETLDVDGNARFRSIGSGASAGALHYTSTGVLTTNTSDARLKTNLQPLENTLNKLLGINTYTFNWIDETDRVDLGMIAQEVEQIFPNLVFTNSVDGYKGIHYDKFSSILTKAIQEQQFIIETQQTEITQLKTLIESLTTRIEQLENK